MEQKKGEKRRARRNSPLFFLLATVMLVVTVVTPFIYYSPENRLARAVARTREEFFDDETMSFLAAVLRDGSIEAEGKSSSLSYTATLPESAAMAEKGAFGSRRIALQGDTLYLRSDTLGESAYSAHRVGASGALCDSAFSDAGMPAMQMRFFRTALALGESGQGEMNEVLAKSLEEIWSAGKPELQVSTDEIKLDGKQKRAELFTYEMDEEGIKEVFDAWKRLGKKDETKQALTALRRLLSATLSPDETKGAENRFVAFLCASSAEFEAFRKEILSENSRLVLSFTVYDGRVLSLRFLMGGGSLVVEGGMSFSKDLRDNGAWSLSLQAKDDGRKLFSLAIASAVTENSDSAYIREWNYSYSDSIGAICTKEGEEKGEIIFSWGKLKGDLGLRFDLGEEELVFRGEISEYEAGESLELVLKRMEYNGVNVLEDDSYKVEFSLKGETPAARKAENELFCKGEKRQELASLLAGRFQRFQS